jgi:hypothetical protein
MRLTQSLAPVLTLESRLAHSLDLKQQIADLEAERKEENAAIEAELHAAGVEEAVEGDYAVKLTEVAGRSSIDRMRLLEAGVTTKQIKAATTTGSPHIRLDIKVAKGKK